MVKSGNKNSFVPEIVLLYCQHCVCDNAEVRPEAEKLSSIAVKPVMMPCSSKIQVPHVLRILEQGAEAVEVVACPVESCRFMVGCQRAAKRIDYARGLLETAGVGAERLGITRKSQLSGKELMTLALNRAKMAEQLGPNPIKKGDNQ